MSDIVKKILFLKSGHKKIKTAFSFIRKRRFPTFSQWKQILGILEKKEKVALLIFLILTFSSAIFLVLNFYFSNTTVQPAQGGTYVEGVIGHQPGLINPIYAPSNIIDQDLVELLFSGLMKYNNEGKIVPDLAKNYNVEEDGKVYDVFLKDNLFWSDGKEFSVDDVIFTVKTIQNQDYKSPLFTSFLGVEVEKINNQVVRFRLKNPYSPFLETLTIKIIPKHIWENIPPQNFRLADYNLQPIGNGPFELKRLTKDKLGYIKSLSLLSNPYYYGKTPFISGISFYFFKNEADLIKAWEKKEIKGIATLSSQKLLNLKGDLQIYHFSLPKYFDVSFNPEKSKILAEKEVREALNYGTNKKEIIQEVLSGEGKIIDSPLLPEIFNIPSPSKIYQFDPEKGKEILEKAGWQDSNQDGIREKVIKKGGGLIFKSDLKLGSRGEEVRSLQACLAQDVQIYPDGEINGIFGQKTKEAVIKFQEKYSRDILEPGGLKTGTGTVSKNTRVKLNEVCGQTTEEILPLKFSLTIIDQEEFSRVADLLKKQWKELGIEVEVKKVNLPSHEFEQEIIKPRDYESILFGKVIGLIPDLFSFWHSSQKKEPGLNLALYENKEADKLLEEARQTLNEEERKGKYEEFQDILIDDAPVVFLYSPTYLYLVSKDIKGIKEGLIANSSKRFIDIENWYIKIKRVWK